MKIEKWAIGANALSVMPTSLRGWRTDWADFLAQGHLVPDSAASENKKSVKLEPSLACYRLKWVRFSIDYRCFIGPDFQSQISAV